MADPTPMTAPPPRKPLPAAADAPVFSDVASMAGYILGISYPVLALSTGVRGIYQLFFKDAPVTDLGPALSIVAAACYLAATVGFAVRRPWAWRVGVGLLAFELAGAVVVGILSYVVPATIGHTAWGRFGADYGFFPLFQPLLGLLWLYYPPTLARYGAQPRWQPRRLYAAPTGDPTR